MDAEQDRGRAPERLSPERLSLEMGAPNRWEHGAPIAGLAACPGGQIASAGADGVVRLWEVSSGAGRGELGRGPALHAVAEWREWLLAAGDGGLHRYRLEAGGPGEPAGDRLAEAPLQVLGVGWDRAVAGGASQVPRVWSLSAGAELRALGEQAELLCAAVSPDGSVACCGYQSNVAIVWDLSSGRARHRLRAHSDWVRAVAFSADGQRIVTGCDDGFVRLWEAVSGRCRLRFEAAPGRFISALALAPTGAVLCVDSHGVLTCWTPEGRFVRTLEAGDAGLASVAVCADGTIVAGGRQGRVLRWTGAEAPPRASDGAGIGRHTGAVRALALIPDGAHAITGGDDRRLVGWDLGEACVTGHLDTGGEVLALAALGTDAAIVGAADGSLCAWALGEERPLWRLNGDTPIQAVAVSPDGRWAIAGTGRGEVLIVEAGTGALRWRLEGHEGPVSSVAADPDGGQVASGGWDGVPRLWAPETGQPLRALERRGRVGALCFLPGGRLAIGRHHPAVEIVDPRRGEVLQSLIDPADRWGGVGGVTAMAATADGQHLISGHDSGAIVAWAIATGGVIARTREHRGRVSALALTGAHLVSAGHDRTVRRWPLPPLLSHPGVLRGGAP